MYCKKKSKEKLFINNIGKYTLDMKYLHLALGGHDIMTNPYFLFFFFLF